MVRAVHLLGRILRRLKSRHGYYIMEWFMQVLLVRALSILCVSRSNLYMIASPLLRPLGLEETYWHAHVHTPYSHDRCVSTPLPIFWYIGIDELLTISIVVLAERSSAVFYNFNFQVAYLCLQVGLTIIYTLVAGRLFALRQQMRDILGRGHVRTYEIAAIMVVEHFTLWSPFTLMFPILCFCRSAVSR